MKMRLTANILQGDPYLMKYKCGPEISDEEKDEDGECYTGFAKDLIDLIAKERKFKYRIVLAPDNSRGSLNPVTGKWNGIIKEVQDRVSTRKIMVLQYVTSLQY